jgi:hypothetical protein
LLIKINLANLKGMGLTLDFNDNDESFLGSGTISNQEYDDQEDEESGGYENKHGEMDINLESPSERRTPSPEKVQSSLLSRRGMIKPGVLITKPDFSKRRNLEEVLEERDLVSPMKSPMKSMKAKKSSLLEKAPSLTDREEIKSALYKKRTNEDNKRGGSQFGEYDENKNIIDNGLPMIFGGLNTEKMKEFTFYYPYNNSSYVVRYINRKQNKGRKDRIRKKLSVFGALARTNQKIQNISTGLVDFRNQQKYYMRNISPMHNKKAAQGRQARMSILNRLRIDEEFE